MRASAPPAAGGVLYVVPVPIGNSEDLSPRARRILEEVDLVAAEDTRESRALFSHLGLRARLTSYHDHNESQRTPGLIRRLEAGESIALVSDAGTPLVSDPGYELIRAAIAADIQVVSVPGPSAALTALVGSGMAPQWFCHLGFLPRKAGQRRSALERFRSHPGPLLLFESPRRALVTLEAIREVLGEREVAIGWNLSKRDERFLRGPVSELVTEIGSWDVVKGEFTLVVAPAEEGDEAERLRRVQEAAALLAPHPVPRKVLAQALAGALELPVRSVYNLLLQLN